MDVQEMTMADSQTTTAPAQGQQNQVRVKDLKVESENDALNLMVGFLQLAQRRGVFNLEEASKIHECVQKFQREAPAPNANANAKAIPPTPVV